MLKKAKQQREKENERKNGVNFTLPLIGIDAIFLSP
jgi:hypothetical protein